MTNQTKAQTAAQKRLGQTIAGRFRVDELLRDGAMGTVYRATQLSVDRTVALKVVDRRQISGEGNIERFMREARIISELTHPNIVRLYDFGQDEEQDLLFLVMEFIEGPNLDVLLERGRLSQEMALELIHQACGALSEPHANGVIHRDLKPENILLVPMADGSAQLKVVDFGVARALETDKRVTANGIICGTPWYMAPEQAKQQGDIDPRADLYALGIILYQMLCGCVPFDADTAIQVILKQLQSSPEPLGQFIPEEELAEGVEALVLALMAKAPEDRPTDVLVARRMIEDIQDEHRFRRVRVETTGEMSTRFDRWIKEVSQHTLDTLVAESNLEEGEDGDHKGEHDEDIADPTERQAPSSVAVDDARQPTAVDGWRQRLEGEGEPPDEAPASARLVAPGPPADNSIEIFDPEQATETATATAPEPAPEPKGKPTLVFAAIPRAQEPASTATTEEASAPFTKRQPTSPMHRVTPQTQAKTPSIEDEAASPSLSAETPPNKQTLMMFDENVAEQSSDVRTATRAANQPEQSDAAIEPSGEPPRKTLMMGAVSRTSPPPEVSQAAENDPKSTQVFGAFVARDLSAADDATSSTEASQAPRQPARVTAAVSSGISGSSATQGKHAGVSRTTNTERMPRPQSGPSIQLSKEVEQDLSKPTPRVTLDTTARPSVTPPAPFDEDELYAPQRSKMAYAIPLLLVALLLIGGGVAMATGAFGGAPTPKVVDAASVSAAANNAPNAEESPTPAPAAAPAPSSAEDRPDVAAKTPAADEVKRGADASNADKKEPTAKPVAKKPDVKKRTKKKKVAKKSVATPSKSKKKKRPSTDVAAPPKKLGGSTNKKRSNGDVDDKLKKNLDWLKNR